MKKQTISYLLPLLLLGYLFFASTDYASANSGLKIQPIKISKTIAPGESSSGVIRLANAGSSKIQVEISVEDFTPLSGGEGVEFVGRAEGVTTVRDWIDIKGDQTFELGDSESRSIPYTVTAPSDAEPGGHYGVLFFKATELDNTGQLRIGTRVGSLVFVTVPGNRLEEGRILSFTAPSFVQSGPIKFDFSFGNTGTVHFDPRGEIMITNIFGKEVARVPISGKIILPSGKRDFSVVWPHEGPLVGRYLARAEVLDSKGNLLSAAAADFYALPIWWGIAFLVTLLLVFFIISFIRHRVRLSIVPPVGVTEE